MSKNIRYVVVLGLTALVSACGNNAQEEEIVFVEPDFVVAEPVSNKF